jgi:hypothetical protein
MSIFLFLLSAYFVFHTGSLAIGEWQDSNKIAAICLFTIAICFVPLWLLIR